MRLISTIFSICIVVAVASLAIANRQIVNVQLPLSDINTEIPLYLLCLLMMLNGIIITGIFLTRRRFKLWIASLRTRKKVKTLESELDSIKTAQAVHKQLPQTHN